MEEARSEKTRLEKMNMEKTNKKSEKLFERNTNSSKNILPLYIKSRQLLFHFWL